MLRMANDKNLFSIDFLLDENLVRESWKKIDEVAQKLQKTRDDSDCKFKCKSSRKKSVCSKAPNKKLSILKAAESGLYEVVRGFCTSKENIECRENLGYTALHLASYRGHCRVVELLLNSGADIEATSDVTKDTPLSVACLSDSVDVVELLVGRGANMDHLNKAFYRPITLAAEDGHLNTIKLLLDKGVEVDSRTGDDQQITPLMLATAHEKAATVKLLLEKGADVNLQCTGSLTTALALSSRTGNMEILNYLIENKADVNHAIYGGLTCLMHTAVLGYAEAGKALLDAGANINAFIPETKYTALSISISLGHSNFVQMLLSRKVNVDMKTIYGETALHLACSSGFLSIVKALFNYGADINTLDKDGNSCLFAAVTTGRIDIVRWILETAKKLPTNAQIWDAGKLAVDPHFRKQHLECFNLIEIVREDLLKPNNADKNAEMLLEELEREKSLEETKKITNERRKERKKLKKMEKKTEENTHKEDADNDGKESAEDFSSKSDKKDASQKALVEPSQKPSQVEQRPCEVKWESHKSLSENPWKKVGPKYPRLKKVTSSPVEPRVIRQSVSNYGIKSSRPEEIKIRLQKDRCIQITRSTENKKKPQSPITPVVKQESKMKIFPSVTIDWPATVEKPISCSGAIPRQNSTYRDDSTKLHIIPCMQSLTVDDSKNVSSPNGSQVKYMSGLQVPANNVVVHRELNVYNREVSTFSSPSPPVHLQFQSNFKKTEHRDSDFSSSEDSHMQKILRPIGWERRHGTVETRNCASSRSQIQPPNSIEQQNWCDQGIAANTPENRRQPMCGQIYENPSGIQSAGATLFQQKPMYTTTQPPTETNSFNFLGRRFYEEADANQEYQDNLVQKLATARRVSDTLLTPTFSLSRYHTEGQQHPFTSNFDQFYRETPSQRLMSENNNSLDWQQAEAWTPSRSDQEMNQDMYGIIQRRH